MSDQQQPVLETPADQEEHKSAVVQVEEKIEGWVTIENVRRGNSEDKRRLSHHMHGLVLPSIGGGRDRRTGGEKPVPRNRVLLPDKHGHQWFKELLATPQIPEELENIWIRVNVKALLNDNIAFVRPSASNLNQAVVEWKTRMLKLRGNSVSSLKVEDDHTLCHLFYTRGFKHGEVGTIARIFPKTFTALVVMRNGYYYELSGADRLRQHVGRAGTNGMILDRDIEVVMRHRQLFDLDKINAMLADPDGYTPFE